MKMRVMGAGCDDWLRVTVCQYLVRTGREVDTADNALDCLDNVLALPPDVIVLQDGLLWTVVACRCDCGGHHRCCTATAARQFTHCTTCSAR